MAIFIQNCKKGKKYRMSGPLTCDTDEQAKFWEGRAQNSRLNTNKFHEDQLKLNLPKNEEGLYESRGRIQGSYPIYLPPDALLTHKESYQGMLIGCKKFQATNFSNSPAGKLPKIEQKDQPLSK